MISEEAYKLLKKRKDGNESFTEVIIRLASERPKNIESLLDYVKSPDFEPIRPETAKIMEQTSRKMRKSFKLRDVEL